MTRMAIDTVDHSPASLPPMSPVTAIRAFTRSGLTLVEAEIVGAFALHRTVKAGVGDDQFTLTHIGSGGAIGQVPDLASGRALAAKLQEFQVDWNFRHLGTLRSWPLSIRRRLFDVVSAAAEPACERPARTRDRRSKHHVEA